MSRRRRYRIACGSTGRIHIATGIETEDLVFKGHRLLCGKLLFLQPCKAPRGKFSDVSCKTCRRKATKNE